MKLSARIEYACLAMLDLTLHHGEGAPVRVRAIADRHGIPSRFLVQILLQLKGAGLVSSTRGASGGYRLGRAPSEVSLAEIVEVLEGSDLPTSNLPGSTLTKTLVQAFVEAHEAQRKCLEATTLADLAERAGVTGEMMYYI